MPRPDTNRAGEMEVFVRVVDHGGFSAAARTLGLTPSAVSKLVARLEARLGARLLHRSTRKLTLTEEGAAFHERAIRVLSDLDEAEQAVALGARPRGRLRVNCNVPFGRRFVLPLVPAFLAENPDVVLDLTLTDQVVDLMDERADIAIRTGPLSGAQLTVRKLGEAGLVVVASPDYLARHGEPRTPGELERHNRIGFNFSRAVEDWPFETPQGRVELPARGSVKAGDGETAHRLALDGIGLARLARWQVDRDIAAGRLVAVMEDQNPGDRHAVHALYVGGRGQAPARVRAFLDHLAGHIDLRAA